VATLANEFCWDAIASSFQLSMNLPSTVSTNSKALSAAGPSHYRKSAPPQPNGHRWHWATTAALPIADDETLSVRMTENIVVNAAKAP
jgi:hypothetical protein